MSKELKALFNSIEKQQLFESNNLRARLESSGLSKLLSEGKALESITAAYSKEATVSDEVYDNILEIQELLDRTDYDLYRRDLLKLSNTLKFIFSNTKSKAKKAELQSAITNTNKARLSRIFSKDVANVHELANKLQANKDIKIKTRYNSNVSPAGARLTISTIVDDKLLSPNAKLSVTSISISKNLDLKYFEEDIAQLLTNTFLEKGQKRIRRQKTLSRTIKTRRIAKLRKGIGSYKAKKTRTINTLNNVSNGSSMPLLTLKALINESLHDVIRDSNMAKSSAPDGNPRLRYQTGRFARSAQVVNITSTRDDAIQVFYTYQRSPYDVFLPGGRLHKPGRNPRSIIQKSIREIAFRFINTRFKLRNTLI